MSSRPKAPPIVFPESMSQNDRSPLRPSTDDSRLAAARALEEAGGSSPLLNMRTVGPGALREARKQQSERAKPADLSTRIPAYTMRELKIRCAQEGTTIRAFILRMLQKEGFVIQPVDLEEDLRRKR